MADEYPKFCNVCGQSTTWEHDHKPDSSGLDDGPPLPGIRKKPEPKTAEEMRRIRAQAWETRRKKYGAHGHR